MSVQEASTSPIPDLRSSVLCLLLLIWWPFCSIALPGKNHTLRHYTDVDGLPQNSVNAILVDKFHYTWMTTQDGIVRFDGNNFRVFNKNTVPGLHSNRFSHFRADTSGQLYAVNDQNEFVEIGQSQIRLAPLFRNKTILQLNKVGFAASNAYWSKGYIDAWYGYPALSTYFLSRNQQYFWECNNTELRLWKNGVRSLTIPFHAGDPVRFFEMGSNLCYSDCGRFWYVQDDHMQEGRLEGDINNDAFYRQHRDSIFVFWNNLSPNVLLYCNHAFYQLELQPDGVFTTKLLYRDVAILPGEVTCIYYEPLQKRLFVGSLTNGLYILQPQLFSVLTVNATGKQNVYYAQTPFPGGKVLTGDGILLGEGTDGKVLLPGSGDGYGIFTDHEGFIWKKEMTRLYRYTTAMQLKEDWSFRNYITCIYEGPDSIVHIGVRGSGLWQIDLRKPDHQPEFVIKLPTDICYMQQLERAHLWIGTGNGLFCLNTAGRSVSAVAGLEGKYIRSLYLRQPDELWITSYEDGLFFYDKKRLVSLPEDRDNFLKASHCIVEDKNGFFWISTNKGLFQVSRQDLLRYVNGRQEHVYYQYYDKNDGFNTNEFNGGCQPCGLLLDNGFISLPSLNGLVWFRPELMHQEQRSGRIVMDNVILDNQPYPFRNNKVELPAKFEQLRIELSSPYYGSKKNIQMWYRIEHEGNVSRWYGMSADNNITFTNLGPGKHTLTVRKVDGFGPENYTVLTITLHVPPPFYRTAWFFVLMIMLGALLISIYVWLRLAYMKRHNKQLESLVARRTRILNNTLQKLTLSELKLKRQTQLQEKIVAAIGHDIKSPLRFVVLANQRIYENLELQQVDTARQISKDAYIAVDTTYRHITNFIEYVKAQMMQGDVQFEEVDLSAIAVAKVALFGLIASSHHIAISEYVPPELRVYSNAQLLSVIIHNLLDNATKYCSRCELTVTTTVEEGVLFLVITDQGPGIEPSLIAWMNTAQDALDPDAPLPEGLGLLMVKELCALLKIKIRVEVSEGTRFYLGFEHYKKI